jgi:hypothetical protein
VTMIGRVVILVSVLADHVHLRSGCQWPSLSGARFVLAAGTLHPWSPNRTALSWAPANLRSRCAGPLVPMPLRSSPMFKVSTIVCLLAVALPTVGYAACSADDVANKSTAVADVLSDKLSSNADAASKMMSEMGTITSGPITEQTCTKLDDLMVRAKKL